MLKALAKDAAGRWQTAEDLRVALEGWIANTGSKANEREIAALMRSTLGDEVDQKSRSINEAAAKLKEHPSARSDSPNSNHPSSATPDTGMVRPPSIAVVATGPDQRKVILLVAPGRRRPRGAGAGGGAGEGHAGYRRAGAPGSHRPAIPSIVVAPVTTHDTSATPAPMTPEPPAAPREVSITVRTIPPNASIRIDDGEAVEAPYTLQTPSSAEPRMIRATAPSYATTTRQVAFDQTRDIVIELTPLPGQRRKPRGKSEAAASPTTTPSVEIRARHAARARRAAEQAAARARRRQPFRGLSFVP